MPLEHYENLVYGTADKIFYLYRKNTIDHIKSILSATVPPLARPPNRAPDRPRLGWVGGADW